MPETAIPSRYIADQAITNAKVNNSAAIATSKLADAANFILRGGSVAFTADQSMGNNKLTNLATPSTGTDATTKSYVDSLYDTIPRFFTFKQARARTTGNITISNPGTDTFDGVTLSTGEVLFAAAQSAAAEIGLYTFNGSSSALTRHASMDTWTDVYGALVVVQEGTAHADTAWLFTNNQGGTLGTTAVTFQAFGTGGGLTTSNFVYNETPSGSINGSNTSFSLANTPTAGTVRLILNGLELLAGGNDYTISGTSITMTTAPLTGEWMRAHYMK